MPQWSRVKTIQKNVFINNHDLCQNDYYIYRFMNILTPHIQPFGPFKLSFYNTTILYTHLTIFKTSKTYNFTCILCIIYDF